MDVSLPLFLPAFPSEWNLKENLEEIEVLWDRGAGGWFQQGWCADVGSSEEDYCMKDKWWRRWAETVNRWSSLQGRPSAVLALCLGFKIGRSEVDRREYSGTSSVEPRGHISLHGQVGWGLKEKNHMSGKLCRHTHRTTIFTAGWRLEGEGQWYP